MKLSPRLCLGLGMLSVLPASYAKAADWPGWRGPAGDGSTVETAIPIEWSKDKNVVWKAELPGPGNSSPIVLGNRVWLTQSEEKGKKRSLVCFDATNGKELWRSTVDVGEPEPTHPTNPHCAASPVTDGKRVVAFLGAGGLICCDLEGKRLWEKAIGSPQHLFGQGASPVLYGDLCILNYGPGLEQFVVALDVNTGETKWKIDIPHPDAPNPFDQPNGPKLPPESKLRDPFGTWATPIVQQRDGKDELLLSFPDKLFAVAPLTGEVLWECKGNGPQILASPVVGEGLVASLGGTAFAIVPEGAGDITEKRLWFVEEDRPRVGTGVIHKGKIIANTMQGIVECLDSKTGERLWQKRLTDGGTGGGSWSSLVRMEDKIFAINQSGTTFVFEFDPEFKLLATNKLEDATNSSPAVASGRIFIRTEHHLWCIGTAG